MKEARDKELSFSRQHPAYGSAQHTARRSIESETVHTSEAVCRSEQVCRVCRCR